MSTPVVIPPVGAPPPTVMGTSAVPKKVSFLKRIGQIIGKIVNFMAKDAAPIADKAAAVAEALMPQFAPEIMFADNLLTKIAKQCIVTEAVANTVAVAPTGAAKAQDVAAGLSQEMDAWIANLFPGASAISAAKKANLMGAVADIINEQTGAAVVVPPAS